MLKTGNQFIDFIENLWDSESKQDRILGVFLAVCVVCIVSALFVAGAFFLMLGLMVVISNPIGAYSLLAALVAGLGYGVYRFWHYKKAIENDEE